MNSRELALVIWFGVFAAIMLLKFPDLRIAAWELLADALTPKLLLLVLGIAAYLGGLLYLASLGGIWSDALVTDTVLWFVVTGLALYAGAFASPSANHSPKRIFVAAIGLAVFIEVVVNFYVFPLGVELFLVPVLAILAALAAFTERDPKHARVKTLVDGLLAMFGFVALAYVMIRLAIDWDSFDWELGWQKLALPVWLTLCALPLLAAGKLMRARNAQRA